MPFSVGMRYHCPIAACDLSLINWDLVQINFTQAYLPREALSANHLRIHGLNRASGMAVDLPPASGVTNSREATRHGTETPVEKYGLEQLMYVENRCDSVRYPWFALRVKSRSEKIVSTIARHKGFEEFLPLYQSRRRWSDRFKSVELPLFPGYVFCRLNPEFRLPLLTIPGVMSFVGIGKVPVPIEDAEIAAIRATAGAGLAAEPYPFLEVGHRVRLAEGPLAGLEGLLVEVRKQQRLVVSVSMLKRSIAVEIDRHWVRPLDMSGRELPVLIRPAFAKSA